MPVSTRSKIFSGQHESNTARRIRVQQGEESPMGASLLRNPHQGLKEKMKALTVLYEQQQQQTAAVRNASLRFSTHPSVELLDSSRKEEGEKRQECTVKDRENQSQNQNQSLNQSPTTKPTILPDVTLEAEDAKEKENLGAFDHMVSFYHPKKETGSNVVRKLSMGALPAPLSEVRPQRDSKAGGDLDAISKKFELGSRILVFVRLRPMAKKEKETGARCCVRIDNRRDVYLTEFATENDYLRLKRVRGRHFAFDASFPDSTSQHDVYAASTANLVEAVLQGRNGSVFCYGATGAGKTYTMLGTVDNPGVMVLAIKDLFATIRQKSCDGNHVVHLSYLEVYNETVKDLLSPGRPLVLREDKQGIVAAGLTHYRAYSADEVMALLQQGNENRTTEPTRVNETSSRSHAILQVIAEYRVKEGPNVIHRVGKLSLIDLAGSERALATDQRTLRSLEGANINRSLLALSSCINALVEGKKHIPYRNSKLTQLLKDSLGGSCSTVMIANISPSNLSLGETQNTLHWADRAKEIRTKACPVNEEQVPESETEKTKVLIELQKENHELRMQLARQQQKLLTLQAQTLAANPSPSPSVFSVLSPSRSAQPSQKRRPKTSLLAGNCFSTPYTKKKGAEETVKELRLTVKALEAELDRLKNDHMLQINQKDDIINELLKNNTKSSDDGEKVVRVVTRASLRKQQEPPERSRLGGQKASVAGELKNPSLRFVSPVPAAKKRSFWDITTANSPSVVNLNGRKTRSHVMDKAPSMLLQLASPCFRFLLFVNYVYSARLCSSKTLN